MREKRSLDTTDHESTIDVDYDNESKTEKKSKTCQKGTVVRPDGLEITMSIEDFLYNDIFGYHRSSSVNAPRNAPERRESDT